MTERGLIVVVSAPSGAGKTTMCRHLIAGDRSAEFSVSVTTRSVRPGETDGTDYHFTTPEKFRERIEAGDLAEWAEVHGSYYGTLKETLETRTAVGATVFLDIDVQGGRQIRAHYPGAVLVFVLPPSFAVLKKRLEDRRTESAADLTRRLENAAAEIRAAGEYDYLIVNDDLDRAVEELRAVCAAEKRRTARHTAFVKNYLL